MIIWAKLRSTKPKWGKFNYILYVSQYSIVQYDSAKSDTTDFMQWCDTWFILNGLKLYAGILLPWPECVNVSWNDYSAIAKIEEEITLDVSIAWNWAEYIVLGLPCIRINEYLL